LNDDQQVIKIRKEYSALVPKLSPQEYESLKQSIKINGLHIPVVVNQYSVLLDGYHRYKACQELGIKPNIQVKILPGSLEEKLFVIGVNLKRRQLTHAQKVELGEALKPIYGELARRNRMSNLRQNTRINGSRCNNQLTGSSGSNDPLGRVNAIVAKEVGLSTTTYQRGETILKEAPELWENQVRTGKLAINKAYSIHKRNLKKEKILKSSLANNQPTKDTLLIHGDFVEKSSTINLDNSIDLIFTDPPYGKEWLPLYEDLARIAARVLKIGGSLVTNAGHSIIPEVINYMVNAGLTYWWPLAVKLSGRFAREHHRGISIKWKPLLWFVKGEKRNIVDYLADYIESDTTEKLLLEWEQSPVEAEHVISRLTVENQKVFDPMMGSGTTGIAALRLNRMFVGIEINKERFEVASRRIMTANVKRFV
jgi:ParB-like chromosome segregation protein Spo0J